MKYLEEIKQTLCKELEDYGRKAKLTASDLEMVHKLTDTIKNIGKIAIQEEESSYSEARRGRYSRDGGEWQAMGSYEEGSSYRRGRGSNAKRDRMGRYSSDDYSEDEYQNEYRGADGRSYRGMSNDRGGRGYSQAKDHMVKTIEEMMDDADPKARRALKECLETLEED
jgi:hypothetical protein